MTKTTSQKLYIARGFFSALSGILALATLITLGMQMDYANFPGSNLVLDSYPEDDASGRSGSIKLVDGFQLKDSSATCSNFRELKNGDSAKICAGVEEDAAVALEVVDEEGEKAGDTVASHGWLLGPPCVKTGTLSDCAPFGYGSPLSGLGQATFGILAINVILYGAHTGVLSESKKSTLFILNVLWTIVSFGLYVWGAVAWGAFCDKIDTGLGRYVVVGTDKKAACATRICGISFGGLAASFATAIVVAHLPNVVTFFGLGGLSEDIANQYSRLNSRDEDENDDEDV